MTLNEEIKTVPSECIVALEKAAQLFIQDFATTAISVAKKNGRKTVKTSDISQVASISEFQFTERKPAFNLLRLGINRGRPSSCYRVIIVSLNGFYCGHFSRELFQINTPLITCRSGRLLSLRLSGRGDRSLRGVRSAHSASRDSGVKINSLLEFVQLKSVLVLKLLLDVLVSLEHSFQLNCSLLLLLVFSSLNSLLESLHFVEVLSRQLLLSSGDLSVSSVVVLGLLLLLQFLSSDLNFVGFSILFLSSEVNLDLLQIKKFG